MTAIPQRTVRVKINLDEEQEKIVLDTMSIGQKVFQLAISLCLQEKVCNYNNLHKHYYHKAKELFPNFPTGFIQSVAKQACIAIKSFNSNNPQKKWEYKGRRSSFSLPLSKLTLSYSHGSVTFSSVQKRIRTECPIPQYFLDKYQVAPEEVQSGHLVYRKGKFFLCIAYRINVPPLRTEGKTVGIDRGLYNVYATSEGQLFSSVHLKVKRRYQHNRTALQQKGTRSSRRKLRQIVDREKRFMRDVNHVSTKMLSNDPDVQTYVLEDLVHILKQTGKRKRSKDFNRRMHNWSFCQWEEFLRYKCQEKGIQVGSVNPAWTSQTCNHCGKIDKSSRCKGRFVCTCGHKDHADINAAKNIRDKYNAPACTGARASFNRPNAFVRSDGCNASACTDSSVKLDAIPATCGRGN